MGELLKILEALEKPLRFASGNNFLNIHKVKGIDRVVEDLSFKALSLEGLSSESASILEGLRRSFAHYSKLSFHEKKRLISDSLQVVSVLREKNLFVSGKRGQKNLSEIPIQYVKGVGPKIAAILAKKGIKTVEDALYYLPRKYEDRRSIKKISQLTPGTRETVMGKVVLLGTVRTRRREIFQVVLSDGTGTLVLVWFQFNESFLRAVYRKGVTVVLSGEVTLDPYSGSLQIIHPKPEDVEVVDEEEEFEKDFLNFNRIVPIYPLTEGIGQRRIRRIMKSIVDTYCGYLDDLIPERIKRKRGIIALGDALYRAHFPSESDRLVDLADRNSVYASIPHRTLSFYELFMMQLGLALKKRDVSSLPGIAFRPTGKITERLLARLPFNLTQAQRRVLSEIEADMLSERPMNRLLQGDVGSGKTVVALISMLKAVESGYQAAIMAPTEILAEQHFRTIRRYTEGLGIRVAILKSGLGRREKVAIYNGISSGEVDIAVGTHALIEEGVEFKNLGFVVIDEQHRFGVIQRAKLKSKGRNPDVLVMTATPIPRTLAMTVYGDLDVSVLDEMPPGRKAVKTVVFYEEKGMREKAYSIIREEVRKGRQAYIVYPLIEESLNPDFKDIRYATKMAEELKKSVFPEFRVGLLHGRMRTEEKDEVMKRFVSHELDILVSTTVIEVGVDVPNATVMLIENAERFGLSQLHQLRGRIGRGEHSSVCILFSGSKRTDIAQRRLSILERTQDGFKIAEADLRLRGPGDFLGTKQSGLPEFRFADLMRDTRILLEAREDAFEIVREDPALRNHKALLYEVMKRWGDKLELAAVS